jgi:3-hydroxyisobutyrate dehydrogenase-like beta-hydroxyacid dehydrogenase
LTTLGFVGLGVMGGHMGRRLAGQTDRLYVYDVRKEAMEQLEGDSVRPCGSPVEVATEAEVVFASLPTPDVVSSVVTGPGGLLEGRAMRTFVDLSTTGPEVAARVGETCTKAGVGYLDAPVSGGQTGARDGRLTIMASGVPEVLEAVRPYLDVLGTNIFHVGEQPGQGQLTKVLNNLLAATNLVITAEAVSLGVKGGLDPAQLLEVISASSGRNSATAGAFPRLVLTRSFNLGFRLRLMTKDVTLAVAEAIRQRSPMPVGTAVQQLWRAAEAEVPEDADCTEIAKMFEKWAEVR